MGEGVAAMACMTHLTSFGPSSKCNGKGSKVGASMKCSGCQGTSMKLTIRQLGPKNLGTLGKKWVTFWALSRVRKCYRNEKNTLLGPDVGAMKGVVVVVGIPNRGNCSGKGVAVIAVGDGSSNFLFGWEEWGWGEEGFE
ncbi:unnamed protein product [Fraxinus pennsylvanica]|uniref:Uncharacterized protein n=1 Tax=Fraxinus pennsylvanica TaxID=56036 RepID=A0AAD2A063_9LAMI|nr:unnamed protein product [Fraxinus pennsylvanica]